MSDIDSKTGSPDQPPRLLEGLSPRHLMAQIMEPTQAGEDHPAVPLPGLDELAPHFPQLEILECLGRGGMGVVYKARQKSLNRMVALKLLAPERSEDPAFISRFEKEAQALAALNHPHIVGIYDFGQAGGFCYLLMEFVDGLNLRQVLQSKRLSPSEALAIVPPVCDALQCAHDHGIVHRDIKPENLLIDKTGCIKIADFGIAKIVAVEAPSPADELRSPDFEGGTVPVGTPDYAAPEQTDGTADHRSDIYSLGVVLYEMLTGERPSETITPPSKRVLVDIRIDEIVLRALEKTPELRFATAAEFRTRVEAAADSLTPGNQPWWKQKWTRFVAFGVMTFPFLIFAFDAAEALLTMAFERMGLAVGLRWLALLCILMVPLWLAVLVMWLWNSLIHGRSALPARWQRMVAQSALVGLPLLALMYAGLRSQRTAVEVSTAVDVSASQSWVSGNTLIINLHVRSSDPDAGAEIEFIGPASANAATPATPTTSGYGFDSISPNETMALHKRLLTELNALRIGFVFPTEELAKEAQRHLRPIGPLPLEKQKKNAAVLLEMSTAEGNYMVQIIVSKQEGLAGAQTGTGALNPPHIQPPQTNPNKPMAADETGPNPWGRQPDHASPVTSPIASKDNSPASVAKAQQLGVAAAAKDIAAGNFRILTYGLEKTEADAVDQETGYRLQSVAGTILSSAFQAECDAYNFAMRDHWQKHVRWVTPMPDSLATKPGSYELPNDLRLVISESAPGKAEKTGNTSAQLTWGPSHTNPGETYEIQLSDGQPYAITWSADGNILWVTCSTTLGGTKELTRFFRTLNVRGPGEVDEEMGDVKDAPPHLKSRLPQAMREIMDVGDMR